MKKSVRRELFWLSVPVLLLLGVGFWRSRTENKKPLFFPTKWFDKGPRRVEFSEFEKVAVTPRLVSEGCDTSFRVRAWNAGEWQAPAPMKRDFPSSPDAKDLRIIYTLRGQKVVVPYYSGGKFNFKHHIHFDMSNQTYIHSFDLDGVPRDAREVKVRGRFVSQEQWRGAWPKTVAAPPNVIVYPWFALAYWKSKPFEITLKASGEKWPRPVVSRDPGIRLVRAFYHREFDNVADNSILLQLRREGPTTRETQYPLLLSHQVVDAQGKPMSICDPSNKPDPQNSLSGLRPEQTSSDLPATDIVVFAFRFRQLCQRPRPNQLPLRLKIKLSDQNRWPLTLEVPFDGPLTTSKEFPFARR